MIKYTAILEQDPDTGELVMPFPPELLSQMGWGFGDTLIWEDNHNGSFTITKKEKDD